MKIDSNNLLDEADILIGAQQYDKAIEKYNFIIEHEASCDEAFLMRGALLGEMGNIDAAISDVKHAIELYDKDDSAYITLAMLYQAKNSDDEAIKLCQQSIAINPKNQDAITLIIKLSTKLGKKYSNENLTDKAEYYYKIASKFSRNDTNILYKLALISRGKGNIDESLDYANQILSIDEKHVRAKAHLASIYELKGDIEQGNKLIEELNNDYPDHPMVNIVYAQYALRTHQQEKGIATLEKLINSDNVQKLDLIGAKMLVGKIYDSINEFNKAFNVFKSANDSLYERYEPEQYTNYISSLINYYSKEKFDSIVSSENESNKLIFIVGMPRSGTTLIEQIVSSHSTVYGAGELTYVFNLVDNITTINSATDYPACLDDATTPFMNELADELLAKYNNITDTLRITDKLPHNFHHIGLLSKLFPNAKFIHCERNPIDTCLSCYFQYFSGHHPYSNNLRALGHHYLDYQRLMTHWIKTLNIPILNVTYENVVNDQISETKKILKFLDLDWEDNCINFHKQKRTVATASYNQVNKKIYTDSIGRWKNYINHIGELLEALKLN